MGHHLHPAIRNKKIRLHPSLQVNTAHIRSLFNEYNSIIDYFVGLIDDGKLANTTLTEKLKLILEGIT